MFGKLSILLLIAFVAFAHAEPPRYRPQRLRAQPPRRFLARQEAAPVPPPAPYPSADELKPAVPFHEEEASQPDEVYGPPDQTYGPPDQTYGPPEADQLPAAEAPQEFAPNPEAEEFTPQPARLTARRRRPQRLQKVQKFQKIQQTQPLRKQIAQPLKKTVVNSQRLIASAPIAPLAPATVVAVQPAVAPAKVVINSQRLVVPAPAPAVAPVAVEVGATPALHSYVVINSPHAYTEYYQSW